MEDPGATAGHSDFAKAGEQELQATVAALAKDGEHSQSGLLQLWWGLMQDQLGTLTREIESVRFTNSQLLTRQLDAVKQCVDAQDEKIMDSVKLATLCHQEIKCIQLDAQTEKEERTTACERLSEMMKADAEKRTEVHEEFQRVLMQLKERMDDEIQTRQLIFERQGEKMGQILNAFRNDVAIELDRCNTDAREVAQSVTALKLLVDGEFSNLQLQERVESVTKLAAEVESQKRAHETFQERVQSKLDFINCDVVSEREAWSQQNMDMKQRVLQCASEQAQLLAQERQERKSQHEELLEQLSADRRQRQRIQQLSQEELQSIVNDMFSKEQQRNQGMSARLQLAIDSEQHLHAKLQRLLQSDVVSKADFLKETQHIWDAIKSGLVYPRATSLSRATVEAIPRPASPSRAVPEPAPLVTTTVAPAPFVPVTTTVIPPVAGRGRSQSPTRVVSALPAPAPITSIVAPPVRLYSGNLTPRRTPHSSGISTPRAAFGSLAVPPQTLPTWPTESCTQAPPAFQTKQQSQPQVAANHSAPGHGSATHQE